MDAKRFDRITRFVARSFSRRSMLRVAAASALGAWTSSSRVSAQDGCPAGYLLCEGICVLPTNDYYHCGACGNACRDQACIDGLCQPCELYSSVTCFDVSGRGYCADLSNSSIDCGFCGNQCGSGPCQNGVCVSTVDCALGLTECLGRCVDLAADQFHCGRCSNQCSGLGFLGVCVDGQCIACDDMSLSVCGGAGTAYCADFTSDPSNCGGCGISCPEGQCIEGVCGAPATSVDEVAAEFTDDADAISHALVLERLSLALLRQGLTDVPKSAFEAQAAGSRARLGLMRAHEKEHVELLASMLADRSIALPDEVNYEFEFGQEVGAFLQHLLTVKETVGQAYAGLLPAIQEPALITQLVPLAMVDARHATFVRSLTEVEPFDGAAELSISREEALSVIARYRGDSE